MSQGELFQWDLDPRQWLQRVRELLDWVYAEGRSPQWLQGSFWDAFLGLSQARKRRVAGEFLDHVLVGSASWDWPKIQRRLRADLEGLLDFLLTTRAPRRLRVPGIRTGPRGRGLVPSRSVEVEGIAELTVFDGPHGREYFHYGPRLVPRLTEKEIPGLARDELLARLSGLKVDALGRCPTCGHYFVRLRAQRKQFCSLACTRAKPAAAVGRGKRRAAK